MLHSHSSVSDLFYDDVYSHTSSWCLSDCSSHTFVDEPKTGPSVQRTRASPLISVSRTHYKVNDWIRINCSSHEDKTRLKWYINEIEAAPENVKHYRNHRSIGLHLQLKPIHHQLVLRCRSVSNEVLTEAATTLLLESRDRELEGREAQSVSSSSHNSLIIILPCLNNQKLLLHHLTLLLTFCLIRFLPLLSLNVTWKGSLRFL